MKYTSITHVSWDDFCRHVHHNRFLLLSHTNTFWMCCSTLVCSWNIIWTVASATGKDYFSIEMFFEFSCRWYCISVLRVAQIIVGCGCCMFNVSFTQHFFFFIVSLTNNVHLENITFHSKKKKSLIHLLLSIQEFLSSVRRNLLYSNTMIASPVRGNTAFYVPWYTIHTVYSINVAWRLNQANHIYEGEETKKILLPWKVVRIRQRLVEICPPYQPICVLNAFSLKINNC